MTKEEKLKFLESKGWRQWYNDNYLVHDNFTSDGYDCIQRGMSLSEAYLFETDEESKKRTLAGMEMHESALRVLANLGRGNETN